MTGRGATTRATQSEAAGDACMQQNGGGAGIDDILYLILII